MKILAGFVGIAIFVTGCTSMSRSDAPASERHFEFMVSHSMPTARAFDSTKLALAKEFSSLPSVLKLDQPGTGTLILKPLETYQTGGGLGPIVNARYTLQISVSSSNIICVFDLESDQYGGWLPKSQVPIIRSDFNQIVSAIASEVNGKLE